MCCFQVVEHLDKGPLDLFGPAVLGRMRPKHLLVSTPNFEYNSLIQHHVSLKTGIAASSATQLGSFRNADHRFEWSRAQFELWARRLAQQNSYTVQFHGVGELEGGADLGHATQIALFGREGDCFGTTASSACSDAAHAVTWAAAVL